MALEITVDASLKVINGFHNELQSFFGLQFTQTGNGAFSGVLSIGTSEELITFTDITTEGWCFMRNLDATNFVEWGADDTTMKKIGQMSPGEPALFRLSAGVGLKLKASVAACDVKFLVLEN